MGCWNSFNLYLRNISGEKTVEQIERDIEKIKQELPAPPEIYFYHKENGNITLTSLQPMDLLHIEISFNGYGNYDLAEEIRGLVSDMGYDYFMEDVDDNSGNCRYYALFDGREEDGDISPSNREPYVLISQLQNDWKDLTGEEIAQKICGLWGEEKYFVQVAK